MESFMATMGAIWGPVIATFGVIALALSLINFQDTGLGGVIWALVLFLVGAIVAVMSIVYLDKGE